MFVQVEPLEVCLVEEATYLVGGLFIQPRGVVYEIEVRLQQIRAECQLSAGLAK